MASHAKVMTTYASAFWRYAGASGSARAIHDTAALGEVFDACDVSERAALGSFVALGPDERAELGTELASLATRELGELFGPLAHQGSVRIQDWASERFTTAPLDLEQPAVARVPGDPVLQVPHWNGRLLFCASETAVRHPGHLEGALEAAHHVLPLVLEVASPRSTRSLETSGVPSIRSMI
jgi:monoamine oxidase